MLNRYHAGLTSLRLTERLGFSDLNNGTLPHSLKRSIYRIEV